MKIEDELQELLKQKPEALEFLLLFGQYSDLLDDQIDEAKSEERTRAISSLAARIFNTTYWQKYNAHLFLLERVINNCYFDSVRWEKSDEQWQRRIAKVLASCGIMMIVAVLMIEFGEPVANEWSLKLRQLSYEKQKNDPDICNVQPANS